MKRLFVGTVVAAAIAAPLMVLTASAAPKPAKEGKPKKIDPATVVVQGGNPYPIGLAGAPGGATGAFGRVELSFPAPADSATSPHIDNFIVTCTPRYKIPPTSTDFPTAPEIATFGPTAANYSSAALPPDGGYTKDATGIHLFMPRYADPATSGPGAQYPPLKCQLDAQADPTLHAEFPGGGGGIAQGKEPKIPTSPAVSCANLDGGFGVGQPGSPVIVPPLPGTPGLNTLNLGVQIDTGAAPFSFCSTDASYRDKYLTDQQTVFKSGPKVKFKAATGTNPAVRTVKIAKLQLTAPLNSSIPLTVSGSKTIYTFDPAKLQAPAVAGDRCKTTGPLVTCTVNYTLGTITVNSTEATIVKPGKAIIGPKIELNFNYVTDALHPDTTSDIKFVSASTTITIAGISVKVVLAATGTTFGQADANIDAPVVSLVGLS